MGKAKWWVCESCHSLNDLPANKCFSCRESKPANARTLDDEYSEVGSQQRVGISVDLSKVGDLTSPDPVAEQKGGGIIEAFVTQDDDHLVAPAYERYDPYASGSQAGSETAAAAPDPPPVPPLREPVRRGIDQLGGSREWAEGEFSPEAPPPPSAAQPAPDPVPPAPAEPPPDWPPPTPPAPPQAAAPPPQPAAGFVPPQAPAPPAGQPPPPGYATAPGFVPPPAQAAPPYQVPPSDQAPVPPPEPLPPLGETPAARQPAPVDPATEQPPTHE